MRLNYELIRDVLLTAESKGTSSSLSYKELLDFSQETSHSIEVIEYHLHRLTEAGYIKFETESFYDGNDEFYIESITWEGHRFLDSVRSDEVWQTVKSETESKNIPLNTFGQIALQVAAQYVSFKLGIN